MQCLRLNLNTIKMNKGIVIMHHTVSLMNMRGKDITYDPDNETVIEADSYIFITKKPLFDGKKN